MSLQPYYQDDAVTIYHGDCREILPELGPVDLVLTDPPYGVGFNYGTRYKDSHMAYGDMLQSWLPCAESLTSRCAVFQSARNVTWWWDWFKPRNYRLISIPKSFVQWNAATDVQWSTDYVLYWKPGQIREEKPASAGRKEMFTESVPRDWFVSVDSCVVGQRPDHPCPRPMDTMIFLVDLLSHVEAIILDPFMGSGTTLRAAKDLGRKAIGIEIEEKYCELAAKRMGQEVLKL